jgi:hypothetical protein
MCPRVSFLVAVVAMSTGVVDVGAQFRRGMLADSTEITLYPHQPPATLLPAGPVELEFKNATGASARVVERLRETMERQLTENDSRLQIVPKGGTVVLTATVLEWNESRRSSTKYVSEKRQVGSRQVKDKNGNVKFEPIYEYGRNKPSVVVSGMAALRVEVRRRSGGTPMVDETARHSIRQEYLTEEGPPSRDQVEDELIDTVVRRGAGRVSPGREPVRVLLARSDDVDELNRLAQTRKWHEWLQALEAVKPHRDKKRDAYRLHNLAVAQEAIAYESSAVEDWTTRLGLAATLIASAARANAGEKYITESAERINRNVDAYRQLADLFASAGALPTPAAPPTPPSRSRSLALVGPPAATTPAPMSNQDVIDLSAAGLDDENLVAAVKDARAVAFDLSPAGLKALLTAKVSNRVIAAMRTRVSK